VRSAITAAVISALQFLSPVGPEAHPVLQVLSLVERNPALIKRVGRGPYTSTRQSTLEKLGRFIYRENQGGGWGVCWPSLETLRAKSRYARDTLIDAIRALEGDEVVVKVRRCDRADREGGPNGRWEARSNVYLVKLRDDALPIDLVREVAEAFRNEPRKIVTALRMMSDAIALEGPLTPGQVTALLERHGGRLLRHPASDATVSADAAPEAGDEGPPDGPTEPRSAPVGNAALAEPAETSASSHPARAEAQAAARSAAKDFETFEAIWIPARTAVHNTRGPGGELALKDRHKLADELRALTRAACEQARTKGLLGELTEEQAFGEICSEVSRLWLAQPGRARQGQEPYLVQRKHPLPLLLADLDAIGPDAVQAWLIGRRRARRPAGSAAGASDEPIASEPLSSYRAREAAVMAAITASERFHPGNVASPPGGAPPPAGKPPARPTVENPELVAQTGHQPHAAPRDPQPP
jgi:hypothetical protein